jgi:hypothetical protein
MALTPAINRPTTTEAFFILLTFTSPTSVTDVFRVVNNNEDVVSRGETFTAYPFTINLPSDIEGEPRRASITIDNVSREITRYVRQALEPPTVKIELVLSSSPDTVEKTVEFLRMVEVTYDAMTVTATLEPFDIMNSPAIEDIYAGDQFPDLVYE